MIGGGAGIELGSSSGGDGSGDLGAADNLDKQSPLGYVGIAHGDFGADTDDEDKANQEEADKPKESVHTSGG